MQVKRSSTRPAFRGAFCFAGHHGGNLRSLSHRPPRGTHCVGMWGIVSALTVNRFACPASHGVSGRCIWPTPRSHRQLHRAGARWAPSAPWACSSTTSCPSSCLYVAANLMLVALGLPHRLHPRPVGCRARPAPVARIQPLTRRFLPARTWPRPAGLLWGFLPCGLVQRAGPRSSPVRPSGAPADAGLGTLPNLPGGLSSASRRGAPAVRTGLWPGGAGPACLACCGASAAPVDSVLATALSPARPSAAPR
jgi:hypothetical protein